MAWQWSAPAPPPDSPVAPLPIGVIPVSNRPFPESEYQDRLRRVRERMAAQQLDALLVVSPENIFYLCGLDYMGYFAYQCLVVRREGESVLITRAMEAAAVRDMVPQVRHVGYADGPPGSPDALPLPAQASVDVLCDLGASEGRLGLEMAASFLTYEIASAIIRGLPRATWNDASALVPACRLVQSPRELECTRAAAKVSDSMMLAAIAAASPGIAQAEVMSAIYDAMFRHGGTYPGFVPLVRSTEILEHEHSTWRDQSLKPGDPLFVEMAGCVHRYHAPIGRLLHIGGAPDDAKRMSDLASRAMARTVEALAPGATGEDAYRAWQAEVDRVGLTDYRRHHCGYAVGIGYPPSWTGGGGPPVGLRPGATFELRPGMVFHLLSWLLRTGRGDGFISQTAVITETGCEVLSALPHDVIAR